MKEVESIEIIFRKKKKIQIIEYSKNSRHNTFNFNFIKTYIKKIMRV